MPWLYELYKPFNSTNINDGYPHDIPERAIDKFSSFQGNNAVNARDHWRALMNVVKINGVRHQDVLMKFFFFSFE